MSYLCFIKLAPNKEVKFRSRIEMRYLNQLKTMWGCLGATVMVDSPSERHLWYFPALLSLSSHEAEQEGLWTLPT